MNFIRDLFGLKSKDEPQTGNKTTNLKLEHLMKQVFGLEYNEKGPLYNGYCDDRFYNQLSSAKNCLGFIKEIKKKLNFDQMCIIVSGSFTLLIVNTRPRTMAMKTSLSSQEAADLMADIVMINKKQIKEYKGSWLVSLERL